METTGRAWGEMSADELEAAVRYHNARYWVDDAAEISDPEYDRLVEALREKRPDSPALDEVGTGGVEAGLALGSDKPTVRHDPPMLSLEKCYDDETLIDWFDKFDGPAVASPKVDGVAVALRYDASGALSIAVTRGNGRTGEEITANVQSVRGLPTTISEGPIEARGEAYMPRSIFDRKFAGEYKSPRNLTAGALKLKDGRAAADFELAFFLYDLIGPEFATETERLEYAERLGFEVLPRRTVAHADLGAVYPEMTAERGGWDFEADGIVLKVDDAVEQQQMGATSHHPRFAIAYKFPGDSGVSTLREVEWRVSRTGAINPIGVVDPVDLSGASVARASLHNLAIMEKLGGPSGLMLGSRVLMMRRGGVIPNIESVVEPGHEPVLLPTECPICGAPARRDGDILCADHNADCSALTVTRLAHYVSVMKIKGFGEKILVKLVETGLCAAPVDLYDLRPSALLELERMGDTLATKLVREIQQSKRSSAATFLRALGIEELGRHVSRILEERCSSIEEVFALDAETLSEIHTIGAVIAEKVTAGLAERRDEIEKLLGHVELDFAGPAQAIVLDRSGPLNKKSVLFTGALISMTRADAQRMVTERGGRAPRSVSASLDYLVMGDADVARFAAGWRSSKLKKVEAYNEKGANIQVIGESAFLALVESGGAGAAPEKEEQ